ncbi:transcriptional regulator, TetR family [Albimonas donghaensis]|uniref:Transcriptional regulator, TetR family n=2 Tax=Albimonas donghaensis TaxID=356660 RepID=A0A1H2S8N1_9RHOB|nr:transcriptional regulator, TetR family [Albimonas donghaensis]
MSGLTDKHTREGTPVAAAEPHPNAPSPDAPADVGGTEAQGAIPTAERPVATPRIPPGAGAAAATERGASGDRLMRFSPRPVPDAPRDRILHAAQRIFEQQGRVDVPLTEIAERAGVAPSELDWHFAAKEDLINELLRVVTRRAARVTREALKRVEREADAAGRPPALRAIVEAFCVPYFDPKNGPTLARLILRHQRRPTPWSASVVSDELDELAQAFLRALGKAAPHLSADVLRWRLYFMVSSALLATVEPILPSRVSRLATGETPQEDAARTRAELLDYLVAAFGPEPDARPPASQSASPPASP